jgi:hypothetical protein
MPDILSEDTWRSQKKSKVGGDYSAGLLKEVGMIYLCAMHSGQS